MQFNSYSYLLLLIPVTAIFWTLPTAWRRWYVLAMSILYYATWSAAFVAVPLVLALGTHFAAGLAIAQPERGRRWFWSGVALVLAIFGFFRYRLFLLANINHLLAAFGAQPVSVAWQIAVPLGISFYSFEAISYLIGARQGIQKSRFTDLYLFIMFWPHLMAGPIVRFRELGPQLGFAKPFGAFIPAASRDLRVRPVAISDLRRSQHAIHLFPVLMSESGPDASVPLADPRSTIVNWRKCVTIRVRAMETIIGEGDLSDKASIALATSKNRRIPNQRMHERSPQSMYAAKQLHVKGSRQLRSLRSTYNCVGMVFANRRTFIEPEQIPMILQDDEYTEVVRTDDLMPGDVALYKDPETGDIKHVGLVLAAEVMFETKKIRVLSQFGRDGEYIHDLDDVPVFYGKMVVKFYSESRKET